MILLSSAKGSDPIIDTRAKIFENVFSMSKIHNRMSVPRGTSL